MLGAGPGRGCSLPEEVVGGIVHQALHSVTSTVTPSDTVVPSAAPSTR